MISPRWRSLQDAIYSQGNISHVVRSLARRANHLPTPKSISLTCTFSCSETSEVGSTSRNGLPSGFSSPSCKRGVVLSRYLTTTVSGFSSSSSILEGCRSGKSLVY